MPHTRLLYRLLVLIAFGTAACGSSETPAEEEEVETVAAEEEAPSEESAPESPAQPADSINPGGEPAPDQAEMAEAMARFRAALDTAANAEGDSPCERSYNGILAMIASMPDADPEESGVPTPEVFIAGCSRLPEAAQTCLNPGYGAQHPECREQLESPEVQAFARSVGGGAPPAGARPATPPMPQGASPGATACERAYNGMQAMFDSMPDTRGAQMPDQARFMAACAELPEETAQCADPGYGAGHPECMEWLQTPEAMAFRNALQPAQ
ncbi:MAG: hypothetical protein AB8H86_19120 [Polyangiales bacterium]